MDNKDLKILANTYGANLDRWPEVSRIKAAEIFAANPGFMAEASELDAKLDSFKVKAASLELFERIISRVETETVANPLILFFFRSGWARSTALLFCALSGLLLGTINLSSGNDFQDSFMDFDSEIFGSTTLDEVTL